MCVYSAAPCPSSVTDGTDMEPVQPPTLHKAVIKLQRCKNCYSFEASKSPPNPDSKKGARRSFRSLVTLPLLLLIPLVLLIIFVLRFHLREDRSLPTRIIAAEAELDNALELSQSDILRVTRTRFVAPSAVRLPRAKRNNLHNLLPLMLPGLFIGNVSGDVNWNNISDEEMSDSEEREAAELMDYDELIWEEGTDAETTEQPTTTQAHVEPGELEWPGDFDNFNTTRRKQARRMVEYMDENIDPCIDFYQYSCGKWATHHPLPRDKVVLDTFEVLRERLDSQLRVLLEQESNDDPSSVRKARDFYLSCMDRDSLTSRGAEPLLKLLRSLGGWPAIEPNWNEDTFDWIRLVAELRRMNNDILIAQWIGPDIKKSDDYIIQLDQTNLGLPLRDYFVQSSNSAYLLAYRTFIIRVISIMGASLENATTTAEEIVDFETKLAKITASISERRNVSALYRRWTLAQLESKLPGIAWTRYLSLVLGYTPPATDSVVVYAETYFLRLTKLLQSTPPRTIANYLFWRFVRHRVGNLDERFQDVRQRFQLALFGLEQSPPRWKDCVAQVNAHMKMVVGALFVRKHFDENSKNDTLLMTQELQNAFRSLLKSSDWLDEETKNLAIGKMDAMILKIGYPDYILIQGALDGRYAALNISRGAYFENTISLLRHASQEERSFLGHVVNKTQWDTAPAIVNAYYNRNKNQMIFPAGILQPPFYHKHFPRGLNFGGIGVVIGHEITHGFDDKGRLFDRAGNMQRWWPEMVIKSFNERAKCLVDQYNQYTVDEVSMQVDGMNTQGENIADNGGIKQAFLAYRSWLEMNENKDETMPGLNATGEQLFFINFAQIWCSSMRPKATRNKLKTSVHSPGRFRVIGTLSNSEDFAKVFNCPRGSPMNPEKKCSVW